MPTMTSQIEVSPNMSSQSGSSTPIRIEIFDQNLKLIVQEWVQGGAFEKYDVEPGVYNVRVSSASGAVVDQTVHVEPNTSKKCYAPLYRVSPHESQQWAYLTQPINPAGGHLLSDDRFKGVWMRLWRRLELGEQERWEVEPVPIENPSQASWNADSVTYRFRTPSQGLYVIQVGGPKIRWKMVALPSSAEIMVLVRPAPNPVASVHPLDIVVSSSDGVTESLLTLLQRGDLSSAKGLAEQSQLAETLLYQKGFNADAAAVGGYFLLRLGDLERLHDWAANLANGFEWMADGPVIHAWQLIHASKQGGDAHSQGLRQARSRLLEAVKRGFPIYTEGLRLLRDGLLLLSRHAGGEDAQISDALARIGRYTAVTDWSSTSTTFTGDSPDMPREKSRKGTPKSKDTLIYVFDVPEREVLRHANTIGMTTVRHDFIDAPDTGSAPASTAISASPSFPTHNIHISKAGVHTMVSGHAYNEIVMSLRTQTTKR